MYRNLIILLLVVLSSITSSAQNTFLPLSNQAVFLEAKELMNKQVYADARTQFERFISQSNTNSLEIVEANYYIAYCSFILNQPDAIPLLTKFATDNQFHPFSSQANFYLASYYLPKKEFPKVIEYLTKVDTLTLNPAQMLEYKFRLGYSYFNDKKFEQAAPYFDAIDDTEHQYTYATSYYLGYVHYRLGDYDDALKCLKKAETSEAFEPLVPAMVANVYNKQQKHDTLIAYVERILRDKPEIKSADELTLLLAEGYYKKNRYKEALVQYKKYIPKIDKELRSDINYRIGYCFYRNNDNLNAIEYFKKINSLNDTIGQYSSYYLGLAYVKLNNKPFAFAALEQAGLMPFDRKVQEDAYFSAAKVKFDLEKFSEAIVLFKTFNKAFPKSNKITESNDLIVEAYLHSENLNEAISFMETQKDKSPRMNTAYQKVTYYKGLELYNNDKYPEALAYFKKSLNQNIDRQISIACYYFSGEIYSIGQKYEEAIDKYADVFKVPNAEKNKYYYPTRYGIGYAYFNLKKYEKALTHFREYVENTNADLEPERYGDAMIRLADCYYVTKHYSDAFATYERATLMARNDLDYIYFQKGFVASLSGKYQEAKENFDRVITKYVNYPYFDDALYQSAFIDFEQGNYTQAIEGFSKVVNLKPGSVYLPEVLKRRAISNVNLKQYAPAVDDYKQIINHFPAYFESPTDILESLHSALTNLNREEEYPELANKLKNANPDNTKFADLEYRNAENLFDKSKYPQAIKAFADFAAAYPNHPQTPDAFFFIGESNYRTNDKLEALKAYQKVIEFDRGLYRNKALSRAADMEFSMKSYNEAIDHYKALYGYAASKREQFNAQKGLMECYFELNKLDTVLTFANSIVQQGGAPVYIQNKANLYLGKIPYLKADYDNAQDALINSANTAKDSTGAEAQYLLGDIQFKKGVYKQSLETLFEIDEKFKTYDTWVLRSFLLIADNYKALGELFQAKTTLNSIIQHSKNQFYVKQASDKLDLILQEENAKLEK
jgi:tetratricopeptide (TPR) repeat protein